MSWLANLTVRVRDWPRVLQLLFRAWFASAIIFLIDKAFSFGTFDTLPKPFTYLCAAPLVLIAILCLFDILVRWYLKAANMLTGGDVRG